VPDYELTRLGSRAFEQLVVSLCRKEVGAGVQVFGDGPDGGREATFDGTINWAATTLRATSPDDRWNGYTVLQSKYMLKPSAQPHDNAIWLQRQIREELERWVEAKNNDKRTRYPDYLIFVTNVDLSAVARTGGIDTVLALVRQLTGQGSDAAKAGLDIRDVRIWHGDQIRTMVDAHQDIRWAFDGLLTIGDVISALVDERPHVGSLNLDDPLRQELVASLQADRWIRLTQAGGGGGDKLWLDDVVVDLPAVIDDGTDAGARAARHVLERGDTVLCPRQADRTGAPGIVLVGGPGQGKTTLSQLIAQAYRAAMLESTDLAPAARAIVEATNVALTRMGLSPPANRRWPVRVDLAKYAEHLSTGADTSLLRWVSTLVTSRAVDKVTPSQLSSWLRVCPWAVILDGLDEVPSLASRRQLYDQIEALITLAEDVDADLLLVLTTRPTGYDERLPAASFEHLNLRPLPPAESAEFADRLTAKRFDDDPEMRTEVASRMAKAAADPTTARLMETPLQVTVMSLIVEKFPTLPSDRYTLFNLYYQTMFDREVAKRIVISRFLADHRQHVDGIHERVGLLLQVQSEASEHAESVLPAGELQTVATNLLTGRGYERSDADRTAERLVEAALHRLVLLVPREAGLGFEIRTLQELMAARAISEGPDEMVMGQLRLLADHPHWRNTWLLAAGRLLVLSPRFEDLIAGMLLRLPDGRESLGRRLSSGPALAAALLEDGLAERRPRFERSLLQLVLSVVDYPPVGDLRGTAAALGRLLGGRSRAVVLDRLTAATSSDTAHRARAAAILDQMTPFARSSSNRASVVRLREQIKLSPTEDSALHMFLSPPRSLDTAINPESVADAVARAAESAGLTEQEAVKLTTGLAVLESCTFTVVGSDPVVAVLTNVDVTDPYPLLDVIADPDLAVALDLGLSTLPPGHWSIPALVAATVYAARSRRPVGEQLLAAIEAEASSTASGWPT